jgi:PQQ-dependent dehydrogenase (s-GDH family)
MKRMNLRLFFTVCICVMAYLTHAQSESYTTRQLACGLSQPWEIKFGPDGWLWVTEAHSYQLSRVDPSTGNTEMMLDISNKKNFPNFDPDTTWPQGGLQGFAFHPDFNNNPYIYIGYVYHFDSCAAAKGGCFFKTKIVRYNYDATTKVFSNETVITDAIPGSSDHNGGRLVVGPAGGSTNFIFYSVGDMGAGHLGNGSRPQRGQQPEIWEGKVLRFNLVADGETGADAWIPNDNPFNSVSVQNAVWSLGHRNPQGLVFAPDGTLYETEHGPYSDDEVNIVKRANNYGFPLIVGFTDGNYDGSKAGAGSGIPAIVSESANRTAIQVNYTYSEPIFSLFAATQSEVSTIFNNDLNSTPPHAAYFLQWPTSAPSGIDYYSSNAIPGWQNSLLIANLKLGVVYRLKLAPGGQSVMGDTIPYFRGAGRFRDIAISSDGTKIYVAADSVGPLKGAPGIVVQPINKGCIMEFNFAGTSVGTISNTKDISLYPNPANGSFTLQLPQGIKAADVRISNTLGIVTYSGRVTDSKSVVNVDRLPAGMYTVAVTTDDQTWHSNLIVK